MHELGICDALLKMVRDIARDEELEEIERITVEVGSLSGVGQWALAIIGYLGIIYVMFSGARRLELRQNRNYGDDPVYQEYVKTVPIMIPFIPLYSVIKYKWLVA